MSEFFSTRKIVFLAVEVFLAAVLISLDQRSVSLSLSLSENLGNGVGLSLSLMHTHTHTHSQTSLKKFIACLWSTKIMAIISNFS